MLWLFVLLLLIPSQLALNEGLGPVVGIGAIAFAMVSGMLLFFRSRLPKGSVGLAVYGLLLVVLACGAALKHQWVKPLIAYAGFGICGWMMFAWIGGCRAPIHLARRLVIITSFTAIGCFAISIAIDGFYVFRYKGVFDNPNSMGWFTSSVASLLLAALVAPMGFRTRWAVWLSTVLVATLVFMLASNSRAAIAGLLAAVMGLSLVSLKVLLFGRLERRLLIVGAIGGLLWLSLVGVAYWIGLLEPIIEKFVVSSSKGDISQGRFYAWRQVLDAWTLFGLGGGYKHVIQIGGELGAHSSYVSQVAQYGLAPALAFYGGLFSLYVLAVYQMILRGAALAMLGVSVGGAYLVNAIFESGSATPGIWLWLLVSCLLWADVSDGNCRRAPHVRGRFLHAAGIGESPALESRGG